MNLKLLRPMSSQHRVLHGGGSRAEPGARAERFQALQHLCRRCCGRYAGVHSVFASQIANRLQMCEHGLKWTNKYQSYLVNSPSQERSVRLQNWPAAAAGFHSKIHRRTIAAKEMPLRSKTMWTALGCWHPTTTCFLRCLRSRVEDTQRDNPGSGLLSAGIDAELSSHVLSATTRTG